MCFRHRIYLLVGPSLHILLFDKPLSSHTVGVQTRTVTLPSRGASWKPHIFFRPRRPWSTSKSQSTTDYQICPCNKPRRSTAATVLDLLKNSTLQRNTNMCLCSPTGRSSNSTVAVNTRAIQRSTGDNITWICSDFISAGLV